MPSTKTKQRKRNDKTPPPPPKQNKKNLTTLYLATPLPKEENLSHLGACWLMSLVVGDKICGSITCYILISWGCLPSSFLIFFYNELL
jgi:hypothetical protein